MTGKSQRLQDYVLDEKTQEALRHTLELLPRALTTSAVIEREQNGGLNLPGYLGLSSILGDTEDHVEEFSYTFDAILREAIIRRDGKIIPKTFNALRSILEKRKQPFVTAAQSSGLRLPEGFAEAVYDVIAARLLAGVTHNQEVRMTLEAAEEAVRNHFASFASKGEPNSSEDVPDTRNIPDSRDSRAKVKPELNTAWHNQRITPEIRTWIETLAPLLKTHLETTWESRALEQQMPAPARAYAAAAHLYIQEMSSIAVSTPTYRGFVKAMGAYDERFAQQLADTELCDEPAGKMLKMICIEWRQQVMQINLSERLQAAHQSAQRGPSPI